MKKILSLILAAVLAISLVACGGKAGDASSAPASSSAAPVSSAAEAPKAHLTVAVTYADGKTETFSIDTAAKTLRAALEQENLIEGEESQYGLFVQKVNGVAAAENAYWAFYQGGEYLMTGVDTTPVADGDTFEIKHEEIQY